MHQYNGMEETLTSYLLRITGARSIRAIAIASGIDPSTLTRQLNGSTSIGADTIVSICRAFDADLVDALVFIDFITEQEAERFGARIGLAAFTDLELAREIVRRIEAGEATDPLTGELPHVDQNVSASEEDIPVMSRDEEKALRKSDHGLAAMRGPNEANVHSDENDNDE